ncbi:MAG: hypothetical protein WAO11_13940, partial [Candidatus Acidiferrum sp.]
SEGTRKASANDQRLGVMHGIPQKSFSAHDLALAGSCWSRDRFLGAQKIEISDVRRDVVLLHGCAADAARIRGSHLAVRLDQ